MTIILDMKSLTFKTVLHVLKRNYWIYYVFVTSQHFAISATSLAWFSPNCIDKLNNSYEFVWNQFTTFGQFCEELDCFMYIWLFSKLILFMQYCVQNIIVWYLFPPNKFYSIILISFIGCLAELAALHEIKWYVFCSYVIYKVLMFVIYNLNYCYAFEYI